jgi:hypothetical protein
LTLPQRRSGVRNVLVSAYEKTTSFPGSWWKERRLTQA